MKFAGPKNVDEANQWLDSQSLDFGEEFLELPKSHWTHLWKSDGKAERFKVLRNRKFMVQLFRESHGVIRMTINKTRLKALERWEDGITWDELQEIKSALGYGHRDGVEVYPRDEDIVNVANMRHIWILPKDITFSFIWRNK